MSACYVGGVSSDIGAMVNCPTGEPLSWLTAVLSAGTCLGDMAGFQGEDGTIALSLSWHAIMVQYGFFGEPGFNSTVFAYSAAAAQPLWDLSFDIPGTPSFTHWENVPVSVIAGTSTIAWGSRYGAIGAESLPIYLGWRKTSAGMPTGVFFLTVSSTLFSDALETPFAGTSEDDSAEAVLCTYLCDSNGWLLASTCEPTNSFDNVTETTTIVNANTSTLDYVRRSYEHRPAGDPEFMEVTHDGGLIYSYTSVNSTYGLSVVVVSISEASYFEATYRHSKRYVSWWVIFSALLALLGSSIVIIIICGSITHVISTIHAVIVHNSRHGRASGVYAVMRPTVSSSLGAVTAFIHRNIGRTTKVEPVVVDADAPAVETATASSRHLAGCLRLTTLFSVFTEIRLILQKLEWLDAKVDLIRAFLPSIARELLREDKSTDSLLNATLTKRFGCFMFVDIQGFTALCEAVPTDVAEKVLELFYEMVEEGTYARQDHVLTKRLGDGVMLVWGFSLKTHHNSSELPEKAYTAALRAGKLVARLQLQVRRLLQHDAPWWKPVIRIGLDSGLALMGLLRTPTMVNPDVIGSPVNLSSRLQNVGKYDEIKALAAEFLEDKDDHVLCTIVSDLHTAQACTDCPFPRRTLEDGVEVQGVAGKVPVVVTFVTAASVRKVSSSSSFVWCEQENL
eukprot:TRINITY_DN2184_c0_g1_i3.p1 TRINITY_DN2184_c0_g1~~TRINITY_DN2184_c0_g1_i3.p1  ORF type:complete len:678 (-),score=127.80 TRINITY_DN2184_c0_g1_i3:41-2074(-)